MGLGRDAKLTSPLRGEVAAQRRVRGSAPGMGNGTSTNSEPLTPTLSPQGRGSRSCAGEVW